jgi:integrase
MTDTFAVEVAGPVIEIDHFELRGFRRHQAVYALCQEGEQPWRWQDVDLKRGELHVRQRADRYNEMGKPKSKAGNRIVPLGPHVLNALREWKLACPKGELGLVFPTAGGSIAGHNNLVRALKATVCSAGLTNAKGKPKYTGVHALRHFYASWCINPLDRGGQGLPPKVVQERLGHSSIVMTMDTYGHLFPAGDDADKRGQSAR